MSHKGKASKSKPAPSEEDNEVNEVTVPTKSSKNMVPSKDDTTSSKSKKMPTPSKEDSTLGSRIGNLRYDQVIMENICIDELKKEGQQDMAYINLNDTVTKQKKSITVQTSGQIKMVGGGIPQLDSERKKTTGKETKGNFPDDTKREFIKLPLDPEQPACVKLRNFMERVDEYFGSEEVRKKVFGANASKYEYLACIREPQEGGDDDNTPKDPTKPQYIKYDTCKMKFNMEWGSDPRKCITKLKKVVDGKKTPVTANTITDIAKEIRYQSNIKLVFQFTKLWANKTATPPSKFRSYGVGFKIIAIEYEPSIATFSRNDASFDSNSDEDEDNTKPVTKTPVKPSAKSSTKPAPKAMKLDSETESEKSEEISAKKSTKPDKAKVTKSESDDSDSDDAPKKVTTKNSKPATKDSKKVAKSESDDSDSDDAPKKVTTKNSKPVTKGKKVAKSESESGSDDSDEIPVKKTTGKNQKKAPSRGK